MKLAPWLRVRVKAGDRPSTCPGPGERVEEALRSLRLHTVCELARCPNLAECWEKGTATFLILGESCTRNCAFCAVGKGGPSAPDPDEPRRVADAAGKMGLSYAVVTSVTRDDLADGGAEAFAETARELDVRGIDCEVLTPDFCGDRRAVERVARSPVSVYNHNVETVKRLYGNVRPGASYERSLGVLRAAKEASPGLLTKSGLMVGLGETDDEIEGALGDLRRAGCDIVTIGQYIRPAGGRAEVDRFVEPEVFEDYERKAFAMGFRAAACGPLVRSSFRAREVAECASK